DVAGGRAESGELDRLGVRLIGASPEAIHRAEDRSGFHRSMVGAGLPVPRSGTARTVDEAMGVAGTIGYPVIVRPSFMLGGGGSGFATDPATLAGLVARGPG